MPRGQGKRTGSMSQGAMGIGVVPNWSLVPVTKENLDNHFDTIPQCWSEKTQVGNGDYFTKEKIYELAYAII